MVVTVVMTCSMIIKIENFKFIDCFDNVMIGIEIFLAVKLVQNQLYKLKRKIQALRRNLVQTPQQLIDKMSFYVDENVLEFSRRQILCYHNQLGLKCLK